MIPGRSTTPFSPVHPASRRPEEFTAAKKRFQAAWDRDDPAHPINDSVEVQRATQVLQLNRQSITRSQFDN